jgi:peptidoglycan/LPS O-acetylase OafA/YrhL
MQRYWVRIIIAALAVELAYAVYIYGIAPTTQVAYQPVGFIMVFALFALGGLWCARGMAKARRLLAGVMVGVVGTVIYYILQIPDIIAGEQTYPAIAFFNHGLKLAGGGLGALAAGLTERRGSGGL